MPMLGAILTPHPPVLLPEVGRGREREIAATDHAMRVAAETVARWKPDVLIVASPHTILYGDYFHIAPGSDAEGSMAAFGLARYKFRGNTLLSVLFLSGLMLPLKAAVIPLFQIVKGMGLMDNPLSLLLVFTAMGLPSTVFIRCGFMKTIPSSLEQAGRAVQFSRAARHPMGPALYRPLHRHLAHAGPLSGHVQVLHPGHDGWGRQITPLPTAGRPWA